MFSVMRYYQGQSELAAELKKNGKEVEKVIAGVPGFVAYYLIQNPDGVTSITLCETRKGCEDSSKLAAEWLTKNVPKLKINPPRIILGEVPLTFDRLHAHV